MRLEGPRELRFVGRAVVLSPQGALHVIEASTCPGKRAGARGRGGISRPRWDRIFSTTVTSVIYANTSMSPSHFIQTKMSIAKTLRSSSYQDNTFRLGRASACGCLQAFSSMGFGSRGSSPGFGFVGEGEGLRREVPAARSSALRRMP